MANASSVAEEAWKDKLVDDIPAVCMAEMGSKLSIGPGRGYMDLAAYIDISATNVRQFQLENPTNPGRVLLERWSQLSDATVRVLNYYLEEIGRHDVIRILKEYLAGPCVLVIIVRELHDNKSILDESLRTFQEETVRDALNISKQIKKHNIDIENLQYDGQTTVDGHVLDTKCKMFMGKQVTLKVCLCPNKTMRQRKVTDPNFSTRQRIYPTERKACTEEVTRKVKTLERFARLPEENTLCTTSTKTENEHEELSSEDNTAVSLGSKAKENSKTNFQLEPAQSSPSSSSCDSGTDDIGNSCMKSFHSQLSSSDTVNMTDPTNNFEEDLYSISLDLQSDVCLSSPCETEKPYENIEVPAFHPDAITYDMIEQRLKNHLNKDGSYIVRPSIHNPTTGHSISIVLGRQIINYKIFSHTQLINGRHRSEYALCQEEGPWFPSVIALVTHYKSHRMPDLPQNEEGLFLSYPITAKKKE